MAVTRNGRPLSAVWRRDPLYARFGSTGHYPVDRCVRARIRYYSPGVRIPVSRAPPTSLASYLTATLRSTVGKFGLPVNPSAITGSGQNHLSQAGHFWFSGIRISVHLAENFTGAATRGTRHLERRLLRSAECPPVDPR